MLFSCTFLTDAKEPHPFELLELPLPDGRIAILEALREDNLIQQCEAGGWNITNLCAILFARKLDDFPKFRAPDLA
jgi:ATP-dependent DNA helicase RecG